MLYRLYIIVFVAIIAIGPLFLSLRISQIHTTNNMNSALAMIEATADKPYVYRALVGQAARATDILTPPSVSNYIVEKIDTIGLYEKLTWNFKSPKASLEDVKRLAYPLTLVWLFMYMGLIVYGVCLYRLSLELHGSFPTVEKMAGSSAIVGFLGLSLLINFDTKIYDFVGAALFSACLLAQIRRHYFTYAACFFLACLNKETAIFIVFAFILLHYRRLLNEKIIGWAALHCIVWAACFFAIRLMFDSNQGIDQAQYFRGIDVLLSEIQGAGPLKLAALLLIVAGIFSRWKTMPSQLKQLSPLLAVNVVLYLLFGTYGEYRIFLETLPIWILMAAHSMFSRGIPLPDSNPQSRAGRE